MTQQNGKKQNNILRQKWKKQNKTIDINIQYMFTEEFHKFLAR